MATKTTKRISKAKPPRPGGKRATQTRTEWVQRKVSARKSASENKSIIKRRKQLQNSIAKIPPERLSEVEDKIREVLKTVSKTEPKSLAGIWAGKGFENLDIENEIRATRDAMQKQILDRHLRNELSS